MLTLTRKRTRLPCMSTEFDLSGLSASECILLAEQLWEHARTHPEAVPVTAVQREELKRRLDALDSGEMPPGEPWEVVRATPVPPVKTRVIISPAAELDLADSRDWYETIRPGLSQDFDLAFDAALCRVARHPQAYALVEQGLRRALIPRFSHAVFYRQLTDAVQVVAVLHTSRNPRVWQSRAHEPPVTSRRPRPPFVRQAGCIARMSRRLSSSPGPARQAGLTPATLQTPPCRSSRRPCVAKQRLARGGHSRQARRAVSSASGA